MKVLMCVFSLFLKLMLSELEDKAPFTQYLFIRKRYGNVFVWKLHSVDSIVL